MILRIGEGLYLAEMLLEIGILTVYFVILDHMNGLDSPTFHSRLQSRYMVNAKKLDLSLMHRLLFFVLWVHFISDALQTTVYSAKLILFSIWLSHL